MPDLTRYPFKCDLCGHKIEDQDDATFWHGYGNCVEITDEMWASWEDEAKQLRRMEMSK